MNVFRGIRLVAEVELRQRVRGIAWYVLLGVYAVVLLAVTGLAALAGGFTQDAGAITYTVVVCVVMLLGLLVTPALSGNAINGDRDAGTLATTQVTLISTPALVLGKLAAAWLTALAFLVVAIPYMLFTFTLSRVPVATVLVSLGVLVVEFGVVAAVGVGLSGVIRRPLLSVVVTYLVVASLGLGTLIAFGLAGTAIRSTATTTSKTWDYAAYPDDASIDPATGIPVGAVCDQVSTYDFEQPRFDYVWWLLAANPYVVLADAVPPQFDANGYPVDLLGGIAYGVRTVQIAPELTQVYDDCDPSTYNAALTGPETFSQTVPSWFVGLAIHLGLAVGLVLGAIRATRAPARSLAAGSRIA